MYERGGCQTCGPILCPLGCGQRLDNGERLVRWINGSGYWARDGLMVHASCAQELRGEAEG